MSTMRLARLVEVVVQVRATTKKTEKAAVLVGLLRRTQGKETELASRYLSGALPQGKIGVGWHMFQEAMVEDPSSAEPLTLSDVARVFGDGQKGSGVVSCAPFGCPRGRS